MKLNTHQIDTSGARSETLSIINGIRYLKLCLNAFVLKGSFGSPSVKPDDLLSAKIQSLCPTILGNICCTEAQFDTLCSQVQQDVKFGTMNYRAIKFVGAGATHFKEWFAFIGQKAALNIPGCSCGDCLWAPVCSSSAPTQPHKKGSCSVRIGSLKARCTEVSLAIVYIILASLFLGCGISIPFG
uniref:Uncharacterized protein n=1 Tax=Tanacetum cinerariifolium TaxID=118510 RepID=A0A6L2NMU0_TANCI|nr:hypothetical protein [Tanacetum cinerariifolium]